MLRISCQWRLNLNIGGTLHPNVSATVLYIQFFSQLHCGNIFPCTGHTISTKLFLPFLRTHLGLAVRRIVNAGLLGSGHLTVSLDRKRNVHVFRSLQIQKLRMDVVLVGDDVVLVVNIDLKSGGR
jgi:hypothetical protein